MRKHEKLNNLTMERIPKPEIPPAEEIIKLLTIKYKLKHKRQELVVRGRMIRQDIYNLSKRINELDNQTDRILLKKIMNEGENEQTEID